MRRALREGPTPETWPNGGGYRLDHLLVSAAIRVDACGYRHDWREEGLSDHSALVTELDVVPG
jgi:endonuclease/exonuclease/phosphatase family metal-dependent hydrolase